MNMKINDFNNFCNRVTPEITNTLDRMQTNTNWEDSELYDPDCECSQIQITISCNDRLDTWSIQTGDNSYTGSCYGDPYWGIGYLMKDSNIPDLVESLLDSLSEVIEFEY